MRRVWRWVKMLLLLVLILMALLLAPVARNELVCTPEAKPQDYAAILPAGHHRPEARTLLTYPEWHIVHAYDDYAKVIATDDPHDFGYLRAIGGFWSSLCALSEASADHGGFPFETKQMVYVIGVSFTAELLAKAAYEESFGRLATVIRGQMRTPMDTLTAQQAADYARFLQQTPWYKWDFLGDVGAFQLVASDWFRDRERRFAIGLEYRAKAAYADVIAQAVASVGADELRLRMIVSGISETDLSALSGVTVIAQHPQGTEIETPRYRELTHLLQQMAQGGADFVEIAGNDDILFTTTGGSKPAEGTIFSFERQGYGDTRHLVMTKVTDLAAYLRGMPDQQVTLEHIHDY